MPLNSIFLLFSHRRIRLVTGFFIVLWSLLILLSFLLTSRDINNSNVELAKHTAETAYQKDILYRRWNSRNSGVYVKVDSINIPNPYIKIPERDVKTTSGLTLTLINPAYMTRQVYEMADGIMDITAHLTSLKPIRPQNTPDDWETKSLQGFNSGDDSNWGFTIENGKEFLRYMRPFMTEKSCLKCHSFQGYKVGDLRGGISIKVPMEKFNVQKDAQIKNLVLWHIGIWLAGSGFIFFAFLMIKRNSVRIEENQKKYTQELKVINDN